MSQRYNEFYLASFITQQSMDNDTTSAAACQRIKSGWQAALFISDHTSIQCPLSMHKFRYDVFGKVPTLVGIAMHCYFSECTWRHVFMFLTPSPLGYSGLRQNYYYDEIRWKYNARCFLSDWPNDCEQNSRAWHKGQVIEFSLTALAILILASQRAEHIQVHLKGGIRSITGHALTLRVMLLTTCTATSTTRKVMINDL